MPCAFLQFSLWFSVFANNDDGFSVILFSLSSRAKTVIPRDFLYSLLPRLSVRGIHDKPGLLSSRYLNRNSYQAGYEKVNIKASPKIIFIVQFVASFTLLHCYKSEPIYKPEN